jgi:isoquinoline 1-oxidoreductase beta subunit
MPTACLPRRRGGAAPGLAAEPGQWAAREYSVRNALIATAGSTSIRGFEARMREAGAGARALLMKAAARRWNDGVGTLDTVGPVFVVNGGENCASPTAEPRPGESCRFLPMRGGSRTGFRPAAPLDPPSKSTVGALCRRRAPADMVFASVARRPRPAPGWAARSRAAQRVCRAPRPVRHAESGGGVANNWWAADRALQAAIRLAASRRRPVPTARRDASAVALAEIRAAASSSRRRRRRLRRRAGAARHLQRVADGQCAAGDALRHRPLQRRPARSVGAAQAPGIARDAAARVAGLPPGR